MKQNKRTTILKLALLVVCIVVLATALVACGEKSNKRSNEGTSSVIVNDKLYDCMIGYVLTKTHDEKNRAILGGGKNYILDADEIDDVMDDENAKIVISNGYLGSLAIASDVRGQISIEVFDTAKHANGVKKNVSQLFGDEFYISVIDNLIVVEPEKDYFKNNVLTAVIPEEAISDVRLNFIKNAFNQCLQKEVGSIITYTIDNGLETPGVYKETLFGWINHNPKYSSVEKTIECQKLVDDEQIESYKKQAETLKKDYTDDSYIDFEKEAGYVYAELTEKLGFHYTNDTYEDETGKSIEGVKIDLYIYDKTSPSNLVVPATIDGKRVLGVDIQSHRLQMDTVRSLELEEGILYFNHISSESLETLVLPKSLKSLENPFELCQLLRTIKYAGTKAEWEELVKDEDPSNWCAIRDYENNTYKYITFKVECSDETITYSHE